MGRTTISLPQSLLRWLRVVAAERRTSMATVIREALEEKVAGSRPKPRSLGIATSGFSDTSERSGNERPCDRYADADIGFVDAAVLSVVERLNEPKLATLDRRHFSMLCPRHVDALELTRSFMVPKATYLRRFGGPLSRQGQAIVALQPHPERRFDAEYSLQIECSFRRKRSLSSDDLVDALGRPAHSLRKLPLGHPSGPQLLFQNIPRWDDGVGAGVVNCHSGC